MSLLPQRCVDNRGINIQEGTSPAAVVYNDKLWVFYNGRGHDGIWYAAYDGARWEHIHNIRDDCPSLNIRAASTPCPLVHNNTLYLFWSNSDYDGILYTTWNGQSFDKAVRDIGQISGEGIGLANHTSPAAASFGDKIYIVWNGSGNDGLFMSTSEGITGKWTRTNNLDAHVDGVNVAMGTSPALTVYGDKLYFFYHGKGNDGTWYFTLSNTGSGLNQWSNITSVRRCADGNSFRVNTSPIALTLTSSQQLALFWTGSGTSSRNDGVWYSLYDGHNWYEQQSILHAITNQGLQDQSNCSAVEFRGEPYIFWPGFEGGLWYTTRKTYDVVRDTLEIVTHLIHGDFDQLRVTFQLDDAKVTEALQQSITDGLKELPKPGDREAVPNHTPALQNARMLVGRNQVELHRIWANFLLQLVTVLGDRGVAIVAITSLTSVLTLALRQGYSMWLNWNVPRIGHGTLGLEGPAKSEGGGGPPRPKKGDGEL